MIRISVMKKINKKNDRKMINRLPFHDIPGLGKYGYCWN